MPEDKTQQYNLPPIVERLAAEVAHQVRKEIEGSVLRLMGFLKPGERGSLGRA